MKKRRRNGLSIKIVTAFYSAIAIIILTVAIVSIVYHLYDKHITENYEKYAITVLENAYTITDEHRFGDMIAAREMQDDYEYMRGRLNMIKQHSDIEYLYAIYFEDIDDIHSLTYAINSKTAKEMADGGKYTYMGTACEEGSFEDDTLITLQEAVKNGQRESAVLNGNSIKYGYMLNGYKVIFDSNDEPVGLLCVEIDTSDIRAERNQYVRSIVIFAAIFTVVVTAVYVAKVEYSLIYPITGITNNAKDYIKSLGDQNAMEDSIRKLEQVDIRSNNEVGDLHKTIYKMESDMAKQLRDIRQYTDNILKMQNGLMVLMADMVETRDSDTGAHIQKTAEYVRIILEGLKRKGYYEETLTPQYIEDVIRSAPLHDVGKLKISDAILNKPGKLTDEEFEIMKTHAAAGKDIIDKAISTVEGETYLREARNMAAYHHERWDGKGYPEGLREDEIPLSARVMAIADVFDALTSPRVYKPAFSVSKSIGIIEESKGLQFDPKCVEAFIDSLPEVREVLARLNPDYKEEQSS